LKLTVPIALLVFSFTFSKRDILERWKISGLTRKLQIKPRKFDTDPDTGEKLRCKEGKSGHSFAMQQHETNDVSDLPFLSRF
jgi:hypothetical protein